MSNSIRSVELFHEVSGRTAGVFATAKA